MKPAHLLAPALALSVFVPFTLRAHTLEAEMAAAARAFLATLSPEQTAKASFKFEDAERKNWHFIPRPRLGLTLKEMQPDQRLMAQALLSSGLSSRGYGKALGVMSLDAILAELEKGQPNKPVRDPELYFFSIFGTPSETQPWGWRVEGHHLALNFACAGKGPAATPAFYGTNPGEVKQGPRAGLRLLAREEDLGRKLVHSLNAEQRQQAVLSAEAPKDILNDPKREELTPAEGVPVSSLTPEQRKMAEQIVREYLGNQRAEVESAEWTRIQTEGWESARFAWMGGTEPGVGHYYRLQGKSFVVEYDNTQNGANHPHAVWRDRSRDFGADLLKEHYAKSHSK